MSIYGGCWDEREHERKAQDDARWHRRDYECYDRYSDDPCKQVYTEAYDRAERDERRREEVRRQEEEREERRARRLQEETQMDSYPEDWY